MGEVRRPVASYTIPVSEHIVQSRACNVTVAVVTRCRYQFSLRLNKRDVRKVTSIHGPQRTSYVVIDGTAMTKPISWNGGLCAAIPTEESAVPGPLGSHTASGTATILLRLRTDLDKCSLAIYVAKRHLGYLVPSPDVRQ